MSKKKKSEPCIKHLQHIFISDVLSGSSVPLTKHQSGFGLCFIVAGGRAADEHGRATVPTQGVLQDTGHFAVPVGHVTLLPKERKGKQDQKGRRQEKEL